MTDSVQNLYRTLLRHARRFPQYNYKNFALRKIKEDFAAARNLKNSEDLDKFVEKEKETLEQLKRMIKVQSLFYNETSKLVVEDK